LLASGSGEAPAAPQLTVVTNWLAGVKK